MRRLLCLFLMLLLPLQGFAMQGHALPGADADIRHEIDHLNGTSHHHDDDGSVHYDDSTESQEHAADQAATSPPAMPVSASAVPHSVFHLLSTLGRDAGRYVPDPFLERPLRPPQPVA